MKQGRQRPLGWVVLLVFVLVGFALAHAGCGSGSQGGFEPAVFDASVGEDAPWVDDSGDTGTLVSDADPASVILTPTDPIVDVTIVDGAVTSNPKVSFKLLVGGTPTAAVWELDRGELGALDSNGVFTASATLSGVGNVTARYGSKVVTTKVTVRIKMSQNGRPPGTPPDAGAGGIGGVGGEGLGPAVSDTNVVIRLRTESNPPVTLDGGAPDMAFLYPYDKTVWPRGLLPPLLQWETSHVASAVYVHLKQAGFEFEGVYSVEALAGVQQKRQPIDEPAWNRALYGNQGDPLVVEVKIYSKAENKVFGPISLGFGVAPAVLKGTVYYDSYNSRLVTGTGGAVLSIKPGAKAPSLAIPGTKAQCYTCHEVSRDGATLILQQDRANTYADGASYDLTQNGTPIRAFTGTATDGTSNDRKFLWSAMYPNGQFAMANSRHAREHYNGDSLLFKTSDANAIATTGWTNVVKSAVTPDFSPDGRRLAFNFWEGPGAGGVTAGAGRSLAVMDFDCGVPDGGTIGCGAPPYAFSNLRELYRDATRYPAWPSFFPDSAGLVFHNTVKAATGADGEIATWNGAQADLWWVNLPTATVAAQPVALDALNGVSAGKSYLPVTGAHPRDEVLSYEPTVNPIASGGYFWVVFTSRRLYGNVAAGDPYDNGNGTYPIAKKLWVAAIDAKPQPGKDPSHPAFYLPGQELNAGNMRGFWVVDPCKVNGTSCTTGDECCNGFCRVPPDGGALVCLDKPSGCAQEFERCRVDGDCCDAAQGIKCINGFCTRQTPR